jgi:hypothetical protein
MVTFETILVGYWDQVVNAAKWISYSLIAFLPSLVVGFEDR